MSLSALFIIACFIPLVIFVPTPLKSAFSLLITIITGIITAAFAVTVFTYGSIHYTIAELPLIGVLELSADYLSSFFVLIINLTVFISSVYAQGYMKNYTDKVKLNIHYMAFNVLHLAMLLVCLVQNFIPFMIVWEVMSLASFLLVIFESEKEEVLKAGLNYLIQMHICICFIMAGSIWLMGETGEMSFDALKTYFSGHPNWPLFILFFIGFGMKAGFVPLHTWLPHAHPAAPAPVSAVMSGVMIKMGVYGILRITSYLQNTQYEIGIFVLSISFITGLYGIINAIVQKDIKKTLAYSSIENIGIIGLGIGLGMIGLGVQNYSLGFLGFAGAFLHILNHSLFKPLLFFGAGSVYAQTHTKHMDSLGGLIKKMPVSAILFLTGALAISGLPPFNGFISEFLIYNGIIGELNKGNVSIDVLLLLALLGLALIGGLAIFCFTKVFGVVFLGNPRKRLQQEAKEVNMLMLIPQYLTVVIMISVALAPSYYLFFISKIVNLYIPFTIVVPTNTIHTLENLSLLTIVFIVLTLIIYTIRSFITKKNGESYEPTWGCGYQGSNAQMQYTSSSYAESFEKLAAPLITIKTRYKPISKSEIFPERRDFHTSAKDILEHNFILKPLWSLNKLIKRFAVVQSGNTQVYMLYAFVFLIILLLITFLEII